VKELRRSLEELRYEKEVSDAKAARVDALEETVTELRQQNRSLEDKIARLCEAPFISDAFGLHESKMRYEDLAAERADLLGKVEHLQEAVRTHYSALTSLKQQATQLRDEKEAAEKVAEELRTQMQDLQAGQNLMQDQLRLYSGDDGVDVATLERALTMVKRASEPYGKLPFLEDPEGEKLVSLPAVKRKLEEYQILNLRLTEESERLESMLKLQTGISRDLHKELEALVRSRDKDKQDLQAKAADFEEIALKRLDKIHALEAQVRQYVYGLAKSSKGPRTAREVMVVSPEQKPGSGAADEYDNALLNELLEDKGGNVRDDENLMEIWVRGATVREGNLIPGSSTFMVIDFFDFESQTTSLLSGLKPQWDFAATYKLTVDDFLLRYLATDAVRLELNMSSQGDFTMLANCAIPLSALLKSRPRLQLVNHPMQSVKTGQIIAHVTVDVRLALPVSELYRLFLERHPTERRHIEELSAKRVLDAAAHSELSRNLDSGLVALVEGKEDDSRLYNELEIMIHRAAGLPMSGDGRPPNAYVHFQLLGHPDRMTNPVMNTTSPEFNEKFSFPMVTYDQQVRLLQRSQLQLSLIDMKGEELDLKDEGLIGEVFIKLAPLAEGSQITDTFNVKNADGKNIAELYLTLKWKHPLKRHRDLGPRALSGVEVETLISAFSPGDLHEGVIDYRAFCRFSDPPASVVTAMDKLRAFCLGICDREGRSARDVFGVLLDPTQYVDEETFVARMLKTQVDVLPMDLVNLFRFIDNAEEQRITLDKFLAVLNLDEVAGLPVLLQNKLRERCRDLNGRGIPVLKLFQEADQWGADGLITRAEFKKVLRNRMGFALVDEPDPVHEYVGGEGLGDAPASARGGGKRSAVVEGENEVLNDTLGSEDNILVHNELGHGEPTGRPPISASNKQNREIFEEKVADFHQRSQQALANEKRAQGSKPAGALTAAAEGRNLLDSVSSQGQGPVRMTLPGAADPYAAGEDHRVSVGSNAGRPMALDASLTDKLATKLQSHYRGYSARKSTPLRGSNEAASPPRRAGDAKRPPLAGSVDYSQNLAGASSILAVENILYDSLKAGNREIALPDLAAGFLTVDKRRTGLVNRMQFAHVLKQFPAVQLYGAELRAAMDFFDVTGDGTSIDYNAFLRLYNYREPELIPAILKLQTMTLGKHSLAHFRKYDQSGNGFIRRADMMKCLKELGHGVIAQATLQTMLQLFEVRLDGQVHYINFFEYIRENDLTQKLDALSLQFYHIFTDSGAKQGPAVRDWFAKLDSMNAGRFLVQQLSTFLQVQGVQTTREAIVALYSQMDLDGTGVSFSRLTHWLASFAESAKGDDSQLSLFSSLSMAELQRKSGNYILAAAHTTAGLEMIQDSFLVYDWRRSDAGAIAKPLFVRAVRRAGFPFTMNEIRTLTSEFSLQNNGEVVSYKKLLAWATPDNRTTSLAGIAEDAVASMEGYPTGSSATPRRNGGMITKFLEKCVLRGIDLLAVFGRYDSINVGRVTSSEFCAALSDMGLSSVTQHEALELADRFRAAAGDFIIYRKIVSELLRHTDEATGAADVDPVEVVRAALQTSKVPLRRLQDVLEYYDRKGNGNVRKEDLETIMDEAKLKIKRFELDFLADKFASGDSGWVNYTPLLKALETRMVERSMFKKPAVVSDEISSKVKALIENWILQGIDYRAEFDRFDEDYCGAVLQSNFREVMQERLRANLSSKELELLERTYRYSEDVRKVSFVRLIHHLHPRNFGRVTFQSADQPGVHEPWEVAELLRQKIRRRVKYLTPGELRKPYQHFARSKDVKKSVTQEDFSVAVRHLGLRVASDQETSVFEMIAHAGGKTFKYCDFVVFVCDPQHVDIIWKLRKLIAKARVSEKEIINALNQEDTNASGLITVKQFLRAMKNCSIQLTDADAVRLMLRFDVEDNQHFDNDRFFRFLRGRQHEDELDDPEEADRAVTQRLTEVTTARKTAEAAESHAWSSLKRRVEEKLDAGFTGNEVFAMFDRDGKGTLDMTALSHGIQRLGLMLTSAEVRGMLRRMSVLAGGAVTKASFFESLDIDLRQFAVDDRDVVGGEHGRRHRRSHMGAADDDLDVADRRSERASPRDDFAGSLAHIKEQMEVAVNPRDRADLPQVQILYCACHNGIFLLVCVLCFVGAAACSRQDGDAEDRLRLRTRARQVERPAYALMCQARIMTDLGFRYAVLQGSGGDGRARAEEGRDPHLRQAGHQRDRPGRARGPDPAAVPRYGPANCARPESGQRCACGATQAPGPHGGAGQPAEDH
jgi:Ca2+-binding EF-hand superfamily protein/FtsZ-binding cell division protein ZapB